MKGADRRKKLLDWLEKENNLSLAQIVERFKISKMTAHRDLELLEKRNALKRIHGGVVRLNKSTLNPEFHGSTAQASCLICYRPTSQHLLYSLTLSNGEQRVTCCPHCGISAHLMLKDQITMALTADYLTCRPHPAQNSFYVLGSASVPCCTPSMLTFEDLDMAKRFQLGFGGILGNLETAVAFLQKEMTIQTEKDGCPHFAVPDNR